MLKGFRYAVASPLTVARNLYPKVALMPVEETVIPVKRIFFSRKTPVQEKSRDLKQITPIFALVD